MSQRCFPALLQIRNTILSEEEPGARSRAQNAAGKSNSCCTIPIQLSLLSSNTLHLVKRQKLKCDKKVQTIITELLK